MSNDTTIEVGADKDTENYRVFESADGDTIVGMYVSLGAAESLGQFATVEISDSAEVEATLDKTTKSYGVFSTPGDAVNGMYVSHDVLATLSDEEYDPEESVDSIGLTLTPSDESSFEESAGPDPEEEDALVAGADSDSDEEAVEIADEEVGLVDE